MIDIELNNTSKIRKTLLVTSFIGISFQSLVKHATGNIEFLGFKVPISDSSIIPSLMGYLIIYSIISLLIKYNDEQLHLKISEYKKYIQDKDSSHYENIEHFIRNVYPKIKVNRYGMIFIDIVFPIIFGLYALYIIYL